MASRICSLRAAAGSRVPVLTPFRLHHCRLHPCKEDPTGRSDARARRGDHRERLFGPGHGDPPEGGRLPGLRGHRTWLGRGRHLVLQHLSGLPVRRPLAPVLVLLRAQPGLVADLLPPARDRRLPEEARRRLRHPPVHRLRDRGDRRGVGRGGRALGPRDDPGQLPGEDRRGRPRRAVRAAHPRDPRARGLRGRALALRPLEPRLRPARQARRGDRHRRLGDPVRPRDPEPGREAARRPAHRRRG